MTYHSFYREYAGAVRIMDQMSDTSAAVRDRAIADAREAERQVAELKLRLRSAVETLGNLVGVIERVTGPNAVPADTVNLMNVGRIAADIVKKEKVR